MVIKKALCFLLAACLLLTGLVGCGKAEPETADAPIDAVETLQPVTTETDTAEEPLSFADDEVLFIGTDKGNIQENANFFQSYFYYFYNYKGEELYKSEYADALVYSENGLSPAWHEASEKYGYVNREGEFVIPPQFDAAYPFAKCGLAPVGEYSDDSYDWNYGYIDETGSIVIPCCYPGSSPFTSFGLARVQTKENSDYAIIDTKGQIQFKANGFENEYGYHSAKILWFDQEYVCATSKDGTIITDYQGKLVLDISPKEKNSAIQSYAVVDDSLVRYSYQTFTLETGGGNTSKRTIYSLPKEEVFKNGEFVPVKQEYSVSVKMVMNTKSGLGVGVEKDGISVIPCNYDLIHKMGSFFVCQNLKTQTTDIYNKDYECTAENIPYLCLLPDVDFYGESVIQVNSLPDGFFRIFQQADNDYNVWMGIVDQFGTIIVEPVFRRGLVCTATKEIYSNFRDSLWELTIPELYMLRY